MPPEGYTTVTINDEVAAKLSRVMARLTWKPTTNVIFSTGSLTAGSTDGENVAGAIKASTNSLERPILSDKCWVGSSLGSQYISLRMPSPRSPSHYKFCSIVGEILADLAVDGETDYLIGLFRFDRFDS
jgi:hypothetical protein